MKFWEGPKLGGGGVATREENIKEGYLWPTPWKKGTWETTKMGQRSERVGRIKERNQKNIYIPRKRSSLLESYVED